MRKKRKQRTNIYKPPCFSFSIAPRIAKGAVVRPQPGATGVHLPVFPMTRPSPMRAVRSFVFSINKMMILTAG